MMSFKEFVDKLGEETDTASVRGLGMVTGNPVIDSTAIDDYHARNIQSGDTHNDILHQALRRWSLTPHIDNTKSINTKKAKGTIF